MPLDIVHSVCPHDCPSTCALDVELLDYNIEIITLEGPPDG